MARNLVICFDGTNNQFGPQNTNVVRLIQVLDRNPQRQRLYYDPGVGTLPEVGVLTRMGKTLSKWIGLAFGAGLRANVQEAYSYLMDIWEPGDQVFLFGFSRGAYTARVLAGLLHSLGLLPRGNHNLVPYVMRLYGAVRKEKGKEEDAEGSTYWNLCREFRSTFARPFRDGDDERRFGTRFVGVWDTVSSVGWVWNPVRFPYTARNPSIDIVRHAISIDERRWFYRQNQMFQTGNQRFDEQWFPGVHSDVGGGYPEQEGGLWRGPFEWILQGAQQAGLQVDPQRLARVLPQTTASQTPWKDEPHESLTLGWWPLEFFPKFAATRGAPLGLPRFGLGRYRFIPAGASINKFTLMKIQHTTYAPPCFSRSFIDKVRGLPQLPDNLPFDR